MTVASIGQHAVPLSVGCSGEPLFSVESEEVLLPITRPSSSASFDWSDFPILSQYNVQVPSRASESSPSHCFFSPAPIVSLRDCPKSCSWPNASTLTLEDDATLASMSSDEDTVAESRCEEVRRKASKKPNKKSVSFAPVLQIRSHSVVLGNHPCCSCLPLELGWEHEEAEVVDFDLYENSRSYQRHHKPFRLSYWERRRLLEQSTGLSEEELLLQEQQRWREQLREKGPSVPLMSCYHRSSMASMRKTSSTSTLLSLSL